MRALILSCILSPALVLGSPANPKPPLNGPLEQACARLVEARGLASEGKSEEAIALLEGIARRFGGHSSSALRKKALESLLMKSEILIRQDRVDACMEVTQEILRRFAKDSDAGIRAQALQRNADMAEYLCERADSLDGRDPAGADGAAFEGLMRHYGETKDPAIARWVASALISRALKRSGTGHGQEAIEDCDLVALRFGLMQATDIHRLVNRSLADKGWILRGTGRLAEANECYDEILRRNQAAAQDGLDEASIRALRFKGINLTELGRSEEALPLFDEALRRLQEWPWGQSREQVACLLINKGYALGLLNRHIESCEVYDELLRRFEYSDDRRVLHSVAVALLNKGLALDPGEAVFAFDKVIARFSEEPGAEMQEQVLMAFFSKGNALARLEMREEALGVFDALVLRFGDTSELRLRYWLLHAIHKKASIQCEMDQIESAIATLREGFERYGPDAEPGDRSSCQNSIGNWQILQAKKTWTGKDRTQEVDQYLQRALEGLQLATTEAKDRLDRSFLLANSGYALFLLGRHSESETLIREAFLEGGETIHKGALEDAAIHPCPLDEAFKTLVNRLWEERQPRSTQDKPEGTFDHVTDGN